MIANLSELLDKVGLYASENSEIYRHVTENPDNYNMLDLGVRSKIRRIGKHAIPSRGMRAFVDNDAFDLQDLEFKLYYPELNSQKPTAIVDITEDVDLIQGTDQVELIT